MISTRTRNALLAFGLLMAGAHIGANEGVQFVYSGDLAVIGGTGGALNATTQCPTGQVMTGATLWNVWNNQGANNLYDGVGFQGHCSAISVDFANSTVSLVAGGNTAVQSATWTAGQVAYRQDCPTGQVVVGLDAYASALPVVGATKLLCAPITVSAGVVSIGSTVTRTALMGPAASANPVLYRAINLGGSAVTIAGNAWEGNGAGNYSYQYNTAAYSAAAMPLTPAVDAATGSMIRSFVYGNQAANIGPTVTVSGIPAGKYSVYLYNFEDNGVHAKALWDISINGAVVQTVGNLPVGQWRKLGPYAMDLSTGSISVFANMWDAMFSGIEIWKPSAYNREFIGQQCPAGQAFGGFATRTGGALDALIPKCYSLQQGTLRMVANPLNGSAAVSSFVTRATDGASIVTQFTGDQKRTMTPSAYTLGVVSMPPRYSLTSISGCANPLTLSNGANAVCTLNFTAVPQFNWSVTSNGVTGTYATTVTNASAGTVSVTTTVSGVASPVATQDLLGTASATVITPSAPAGQGVAGVTCTRNGGGGEVGTWSGGSYTIAANVLVGDDVLNCSATVAKLPVLTVKQSILGRVSATDQFTASVSAPATSATTSGAGLGENAVVLGPVSLAAGASVALTEKMATGAPSALTAYKTWLTCTNGGATVFPRTLIAQTAGTASQSITGAYGDDLVCTWELEANAAKVTVASLTRKAGGALAFAGTNGYSGETLVSPSADGTATGAGFSVTAINTDTRITETIPPGWRFVGGSCFDRNRVVTGNPAQVGSITGSGQITIAATHVRPGADLLCTFEASYDGFNVSGKVWLDTGVGGGVAHNLIQDGAEPGSDGIPVRLTDCGATTYQTTTATDGSYSLSLTGAVIGSSVCVEERAPSGWVSVGGRAGTTGGTYNLALDRVQFTLSANTSYTGVDFADVPVSTFSGASSGQGEPGQTMEYRHRFVAGTKGVATFTQTQSRPGWSGGLFVDGDCDGVLSSMEQAVPAGVLSLNTADAVCLIEKVFIPAGAAGGAINESRINVSFALSSSAIVSGYQASDMTTVGKAGLRLGKEVRKVQSCPSTGADTAPWGLSNQVAPGDFVEYRLNYVNATSDVVKGLEVRDMVQPYTEFRSASCGVTPSGVNCAVPALATSSAPAVGGRGAVIWKFSDAPGLSAGGAGHVIFCVRMEP